MRAHLRKRLRDLDESFWVRPMLLVAAAILLGEATVWAEKHAAVPDWLVNQWLYTGGGQGARTLLGAIASSTIGVASTAFSVTIAALALAAGQMGPRLLTNFTRDKGNQLTLGVFLGTFAYALDVLRTVRGANEGEFVPHLAVTLGMLLALCCVAMLIYFVHHVASRINVGTVIDLVHDDLRRGIAALTLDRPPPAPPPEAFWRGAVPVGGDQTGYLQELDEEALADWAAARGAALRLLIRPGDFVVAGVPVALLLAPPSADGAALREAAARAVRAAAALGEHRSLSMDLEFAVSQLVEVAVRALSPGINDPNTAMGVLERLGAALCELAPRHMPSGVALRDGRPALMRPVTDYAGLADAMFLMIRQYAADSPAVLIRFLDVLAKVASCERDPARLALLRDHAEAVMEDGDRAVANARDRRDLAARHARFLEVLRLGASAGVGGAHVGHGI